VQHIRLSAFLIHLRGLLSRRDRIHAGRYASLDGALQQDFDSFFLVHTGIHRRVPVDAS